MKRLFQQLVSHKSQTYTEVELERLGEMGRNATDVTNSAENPESLGSSNTKDVNATHWFDRFQGWRGVTSLGAAISGIVLITNIAVLVWAIKGPSHYDYNGSYVIHRGSCSRMSWISTWWHILINVLSTALLGYKTLNRAKAGWLSFH